MDNPDPEVLSYCSLLYNLIIGNNISYFYLHFFRHSYFILSFIATTPCDRCDPVTQVGVASIYIRQWACREPKFLVVV